MKKELGNVSKTVYLWGREMRLNGNKLVARPAYRPKNSGKYGEKTVRISVPVSLIPAISAMLEKYVDIENAKKIIKSNSGYTTIDIKDNDK